MLLRLKLFTTSSSQKAHLLLTLSNGTLEYLRGLSWGHADVRAAVTETGEKSSHGSSQQGYKRVLQAVANAARTSPNKSLMEEQPIGA